MLAKALSLITGRTYTPAPGRSAAGIAPIAGVSLPEDARRPAGMLVLSPQDPGQEIVLNELKNQGVAVYNEYNQEAYDKKLELLGREKMGNEI